MMAEIKKQPFPLLTTIQLGMLRYLLRNTLLSTHNANLTHPNQLTEISTSGDTDGISAAIKCLSSSQEKSPV